MSRVYDAILQPPHLSPPEREMRVEDKRIRWWHRLWWELRGLT